MILVAVKAMSETLTAMAGAWSAVAAAGNGKAIEVEKLQAHVARLNGLLDAERARCERAEARAAAAEKALKGVRRRALARSREMLEMQREIGLLRMPWWRRAAARMAAWIAARTSPRDGR